MNRDTLIKMLENYSATDKEILFKNQILLFINKHSNCFERSLEIGHITASSWLLNKDESKALLMHHAKLNKWVQLGGHCDGNPDVLSVAIKETQEESGIQNIVPISSDIFDIDIHKIPETKKEKEHLHYDLRFLLRVASNEQIIKNSESKELRWISKERSELPTNEPSVARLFDKWLKIKR